MTYRFLVSTFVVPGQIAPPAAFPLRGWLAVFCWMILLGGVPDTSTAQDDDPFAPAKSTTVNAQADDPFSQPNPAAQDNPFGSSQPGAASP